MLFELVKIFNSQLKGADRISFIFFNFFIWNICNWNLVKYKRKFYIVLHCYQNLLSFLHYSLHRADFRKTQMYARLMIFALNLQLLLKGISMKCQLHGN